VTNVEKPAPRTIPAELAEELFDIEDGDTTEDLCWTRICEQGHGARRWSERRTVVVREESTGYFWGFDYEHGLTEEQENMYPWDPYWVGDRSVSRAVEIYPLQRREKVVVEYR
jgi:hypothetical protein